MSEQTQDELAEDYLRLLVAHPADQYAALQVYLSSNVNGKRTIDAAREYLAQLVHEGQR